MGVVPFRGIVRRVLVVGVMVDDTDRGVGAQFRACVRPSVGAHLYNTINTILILNPPPSCWRYDIGIPSEMLFPGRRVGFAVGLA